MAAYGTSQREPLAQLLQFEPVLSRRAPAAPDVQPGPSSPCSEIALWNRDAASLIDSVLDRLVERIAATVVERIRQPGSHQQGDWLDSREAAEYIGLHRDTLRRLAAARVIPAEQDGRGCKLFFRRAALDDWRRAGGRARHLATAVDAA